MKAYKASIVIDNLMSTKGLRKKKDIADRVYNVCSELLKMIEDNQRLITKSVKIGVVNTNYSLD